MTIYVNDMYVQVQGGWYKPTQNYFSVQELMDIAVSSGPAAVKTLRATLARLGVDSSSNPTLRVCAVCGLECRQSWHR